MGKATRWLRALFGGRKPPSEPKPPTKDQKSKKWGNLMKSFREKDRNTPTYISNNNDSDDDVEEQNKRAIAVAAATAAVAEAAVAAAQAAAAVVRLTSSGRINVNGGGKKEELSAAVKIQSAFRAYLARRALRALKGLVKLQALVRGNIVRKQAAETLRCMHALVRVQARARACRAIRLDMTHRKLSSQTNNGPATPEKFEQPNRANVGKPERSSTLKRNSSRQIATNAQLNQDQAQPSGSKWLDQWMEDRYLDSASKFSSVKTATPVDDEKNAKILEIDPGKPHNQKSKRKINYAHNSWSPMTSELTQSFTTVPDSPSKDSTIAQRSIPSPSSVGYPVLENYDFGGSPQFFSASSSRLESCRKGPFTPAKSECSRSLFSEYSNYPSYMANTESSRAKVRSQSAPKQRLEFEKSGSVRRHSGNRSSLIQTRFSNKTYPGSGRLDRLGMPITQA